MSEEGDPVQPVTEEGHPKVICASPNESNGGVVESQDAALSELSSSYSSPHAVENSEINSSDSKIEQTDITSLPEKAIVPGSSEIKQSAPNIISQPGLEVEMSEIIPPVLKSSDSAQISSSNTVPLITSLETTQDFPESLPDVLEAISETPVSETPVPDTPLVQNDVATPADSSPSTAVAHPVRVKTPPNLTPSLDEEGLACINDLDSDLPDEIDCAKVLVRGISETVKDETLKKYFGKYGTVRVAKIKRDAEGKSKGFGVIMFEDTSNIDKALDKPVQELDGGEVSLSKAMPSYDKMRTNKLFVGGLPSALTEDQLKAYFEAFGKIQNFQFILNKVTNTRKAFCFIIFESEEAVERITEGKIPPNSVVHTIDGHTVDCKKKFEEDHPVQKKIKARSSLYSNTRTYTANSNTKTFTAAAGFEAAAAAAYTGFPGTTAANFAYPTAGYEQYYGAAAYAAAAAGYPGYPTAAAASYPGYPAGFHGYAAFPTAASFAAYPAQAAAYHSAYGPMKQNRNGGANFKPY